MFKKVISFFFKSKNILCIIAFFWLVVIGTYKPWKQNLVVNDVVSYYGYLPAKFIFNDIKLENKEHRVAGNDFPFWPEIAPNGGKVIKTTMGLSFLYAPFFFIGHVLAPAFHQPQDGLSPPYQISLVFGCLFYVLLGFYFLRKLLRSYFSEKVSSLTMISVFFGTNLLWYSSINGLMSHGYLFSMLTVFIYLVVKWHRKPKVKTAVFIGLAGGLITLIRPTMLIAFFIFVLFDVYNKQSLTEKIKLFQKHFLHLIVIGICTVLMIFPQLLYWKYITGNWLFFSYQGERFYFNQPHLVQGLFGFRKGWLLYTPVMAFAVIGIFYVRKHLRSFFLPVIIIFPLMVYVLLSWWAWWYGGGFGLRAFVDFYGLFALPMACFYKQILESANSKIRKGLYAIVALFIYLNLFQTWQYNKGIIHYDAMTKEAYFSVFLSKNSEHLFEYLSDPNYKKAKAGLPEIYTQEEIREIRPEDRINLKGSNFKITGYDNSTEVMANFYEMVQPETFSIAFSGNGNKITIKAGNGKFVCADHSIGEKLIANRDQAGAWETFELIYLGDNKVALKAYNNKYVSIHPEEPFGLFADGDTISYPQTFRIFINEF
ncbi:MAG: hypothetical protein JWP12_2390 [Bacteroidetes bacterium]|nr:hypothetical protein [Bacteroidota bacterium]